MPISSSEEAHLTGPLSDYMARIEALVDAQIKGKPQDEYEGIFSGAQDLEGSLRLLDGSSNFMPVCCLVKQGEPNPPVFRAEGFGNFGSPWDKLGTFSDYLERKLEGYTQAS